MSTDTSRKLFGATLPEVRGQTSEGHVPEIVLEMVSFLRANDAAAEEGLFRVAGLTSTMDALKEAYDRDHTVDLENFLPKLSVHDVASLLKTYIRTLQEPLFVSRYYDSMISLAKNSSDDGTLIQKAVMVLLKLPLSNRDTLLFLLDYLREVSHQSNVNKMTVDNIALVWAPNIIREPPERAAQAMFDGEYTKRIVATLISEIGPLREKCREADARLLKRDLLKLPSTGTVETIHAAGVAPSRPRLASMKGRTWSPVAASTNASPSKDDKKKKGLSLGSVKRLPDRSKDQGISFSKPDSRRGSLQETSISQQQLQKSPSGASVRSASPTDMPSKVKRSEDRRNRTWSHAQVLASLDASTAADSGGRKQSSRLERKSSSRVSMHSASTASSGLSHHDDRKSPGRRRSRLQLWISIAELDGSLLYHNLVSKEQSTTKPDGYLSSKKVSSDWRAECGDDGEVYYINMRTNTKVANISDIKPMKVRSRSSSSRRLDSISASGDSRNADADLVDTDGFTSLSPAMGSACLSSSDSPDFDETELAEMDDTLPRLARSELTVLASLS